MSGARTLINGLLVLILIFIFSCNKDEDPTILFIQPLNSHMAVKMNEIVSFNIEGTTENNLKSFRITSKTEQEYTKTILDTSISGKSFILFYEFEVPEYESDEVTINLNFILTDNKGNQGRIGKVLYATGKKYLEETAGHVFYSHASEKQDAYDLLNEEPIYSALHDTVHIMDVSVDSVDGNTLRRRWESTAGLKFVRFNDFDYANATYESLKNSYEAGSKNNYLLNIKDEDIIMTKVGEELIAIKITAVFDVDSTNMDRYNFNIKRVRN